MIALSEKAGNPAASLRSSYQELMKETDSGVLAHNAIDIVRRHEGRGASSNNVRRFVIEMERLRNLSRIQSYITNFILKADGYGVIS